MAENPGHSAKVKEKVALCLLKNMEVVKSAEEPIRAAWLDLNQISVLEDQLNTFVQGFSFIEDSFLSNGGTEEVRLLNQVSGEQSFQAHKSNIKIVDKSQFQTDTSIVSRVSNKALIKSRVNVSGDRSIDMFASEVNSCTAGPNKSMNFMDDSQVETAAQASGNSRITTKKGSTAHGHKQTETFS